jgi:hypothetical protein
MDRTVQLKTMLEHSLQTSASLQRGLGVSQATVSRLVRQAGQDVIVVGRGRSTRYGLATEVFDSGYVQPLFEVREGGALQQIGELRAFAWGGFYVITDDSHWWLRGVSKTGIFESLPYFLYELCPAGFLGRMIARSLAEDWGFPSDPRRWTDWQIGRYLLRRGHDLPGNLVVGEAAAHRANELEPVAFTSRRKGYPQRVREVTGTGPVGSSAVGEQPKFTAYDRKLGHLIVKYSPLGDSPITARKLDLLRAEADALAVLRELSVEVAPCTVRDVMGRVYLESQRFDRVGARGRRASISMSMVDAEYTGAGQGWTNVGAALAEASLLSKEDLLDIGIAETFGHWIGNNDMHLGNLSLSPGAKGFSLLPVYDMAPMAFAPREESLPVPSLRPPLRTKHNEHCWDRTRQAAEGYFASIADDSAYSDDFRDIAGEEALRLRNAGTHFSP